MVRWSCLRLYFRKKHSREYRAVNRQNTNMGLLYAGWRLPLDTKGQALSITTAASFSSSSNRLSSVSTEGQNSSGSWTNQAWEGTVKAAWNLPVGKNLVLTPYIGMEYTDVAARSIWRNWRNGAPGLTGAITAIWLALGSFSDPGNETGRHVVEPYGELGISAGCIPEQC